ncbi:MAG: flagellar hook-associated protein FlgK [Rhodospirillaceae bacterium]
MPLSLSLLNALSGLNVNQRGINIASQNVANVNTEGYTRKIVHQESVSTDGVGHGVAVSAISRNVNEYLLRDLRGTTSIAATNRVQDYYFQRMQDLFGSPDSSGSLAATLTTLGTQFQALSASPESQAMQTAVVDAADRAARQFNDMGRQIQDLRLEADNDIAATVAAINADLEEIKTLNEKIARNLALKLDATELEDQRDVALTRISEHLDVNYFKEGSGKVLLYTATGVPLLDQTVHPLSHNTVSSMDPGLTWSAGNLDGIMVGATDITTTVRDGKLRGLIEMRDYTLPNLYAQVDELAATLRDEMNALHNKGTAYPGATSLTGTRTFVAADPPNWSGTLRVASTDTEGTVTGFQDFDLATYATVGDLVAAIDAMPTVSASIDAGGHVVIAGAGGNRVALNEMDSAVVVGGRTVGASEFLGLNDLYVTNAAYDAYSSDFQTSQTAPIGLAGTLTFEGAFGAANVNYVAGDGLADLAASINADGTLAAAGITATVLREGSGYRLRIEDAQGDNVFVTDSGTLAGVINLKERDNRSALDISVRASVLSDPSLVARGTLSGDPALAVGDRGISVGDNSVIQAMSARFVAGIDFPPTGGLSAATRSIADYAASILSLNSSQATSVSNALETNNFLVENLQHRTASISGVNIDEEMANLIALQNAYAASARVVTVTKEMMELLERI